MKINMRLTRIGKQSGIRTLAVCILGDIYYYVHILYGFSFQSTKCKIYKRANYVVPIWTALMHGGYGIIIAK